MQLKSEMGITVSERQGKSLGGSHYYLEITQAYFLSCFVGIPNLQEMVFGGCTIVTYHREWFFGESNNQLGVTATTAWVERLDDKELICLLISKYNLTVSCALLWLPILFDGYFGIDSVLSAPAFICTYQ